MAISGDNSMASLDPLSDDDGQQPTTVIVVAALCGSLLALVTVTGNLLVIIAFARNKNLRSITNSFLVSLACADLLVGVAVIPFYISLQFANQDSWYLGQWTCYFFISLDVMACSASILHLCVISADRYVAIIHPLTYPLKMTRRVACVAVLVAWGLSFCVSFPWMLHWHAVMTASPGRVENKCLQPLSALYGIVSSGVSFFIPAVIIIVLYVKMFRVARQHNARIQKGRLQLGNIQEGNHQEPMRIHRGGHAQTQTRLHREYQAAKTVGLVVGAFMVCWLPVFIMIVINPWCQEACTKPRSHINWLGFVNSAVNPFIYAFTNLQFREAFARIVCFARNGTHQGRVECRQNQLFAGHTPQTHASSSTSTSYPLSHIYF